MVNAFASEWVKLRRRTLLVWTYAAMAGVSVLVTVLTFARAGRPASGRGPGGETLITLAQLAQPNGFVRGLTVAARLLGVVALSVAAAQVAMEYGNGTLRNLLVRQPRRGMLLAGKYLAVLTFMAGAVLVITVFATAASFVMAPTRNVPTSAWTSGAGFAALGRAVGEVTFSVCGYATLGMVLGVVLRSSVAAVAVGVAYLLPFEEILGAVVKGSERWLPGRLLAAVSQGGTPGVRFGAALATASVYLAIAAAAGSVLFVRRDVTV